MRNCRIIWGFIVPLLALVLNNLNLEAQKKVVFDRKTDSEADRTYLSNILFIDTNSMRIDTFNIVDNNPCNSFSFFQIPNMNPDIIEYKLSETDVQKIIDENTRKLYIDNFRNMNLNDDSALARVEVYKNGMEENFIVLSYILTIYDNRCPGEVSSVIVLNKNGDILNKMIPINSGAYNLSISSNGEYFTTVPGVHIDEDLVMPFDIRIYETRTGREIYKLKPTGNIGLPFCIGNYLINGISNCNSTGQYTLCIFDVSKRSVYIKSYDYSQMNSVKEFNADGIVFRTNENSTYLDPYDSNCTKELIE
jgi:hypothetical protein